MHHDTTGSARKRRGDSAKIRIKGAWTAIPNRLLKDKRLSRDARLLGSLMFLHAGNTDKAFPSQEELADELSHFVAVAETDPETGAPRTVTVERKITVRSVQRWLTELREAGWLRWRQTLKNNEYTLLDPTESGPESPLQHEGMSDSSLNDALIGATAVSPRATEGSHGEATQGSPRATEVSWSGAIEGSAPTTEESSQATEESPPTMLESDSSDVDSSSSDTAPAHHPDDDDDAVVRYLQALGISAAEEFRGLDFAAVQERVAMLQRDPNCRPGAIVKSLRDCPPRRGTAMGTPEYLTQLRAQYGDLFRLGSDVSDLAPAEDEEWEQAAGR